MHVFLDTYGKTGKFNKTNLKRVDAAMDRFVEYDPRIGTKLAYMVNAGARGLCEGAEDGIDYLKVSGIGMTVHDTRKKYKKPRIHPWLLFKILYRNERVIPCTFP